MKVLLATLLGVILIGPLARGQETNIHIAFDNGRVTLAVTDALVTDVLAEWTRVGGTVISGADALAPARITLNLIDADERSAMEALLAPKNGFLAMDRPDAPVDRSRLGRLMVGLSLGGATTQKTPDAPVEIDMSLPESRFAYPGPANAGSLDDPDSIASRALMPRAASTPSSPAPDQTEIPEVRFQYTETMPLAPPSTDTDTDTGAKPSDKAAP